MFSRNLFIYIRSFIYRIVKVGRNREGETKKVKRNLPKKNERRWKREVFLSCEVTLTKEFIKYCSSEENEGLENMLLQTSG